MVKNLDMLRGQSMVYIHIYTSRPRKDLAVKYSYIHARCILARNVTTIVNMPCAGRCSSDQWIAVSEVPCASRCSSDQWIAVSEVPCAGRCCSDQWIAVSEVPCAGRCCSDQRIAVSEVPCAGRCCSDQWIAVSEVPVLAGAAQTSGWQSVRPLTDRACLLAGVTLF